MTDYTTAMSELSDAVMEATLNSPEWVKSNAALSVLDDAQIAESQAALANARRGITGADAKLQAITTGVRSDPASQFLSHITERFDRRYGW